MRFNENKNMTIESSIFRFRTSDKIHMLSEQILFKNEVSKLDHKETFPLYNTRTSQSNSNMKA